MYTNKNRYENPNYLNMFKDNVFILSLKKKIMFTLKN